MTSSATLGLVRHEDIIQPFILHQSSVRGRMVRLCPSIHTILSRHPYHPVVKHLLGEMLTIAAMLASNLKDNGILTIQAKGNGPVDLIVVDAVSGGGLRGYARTSEDANAKLDKLLEQAEQLPLNEIMGEGYLAITLDLGFGDPYQGIVPLEGETLQEAVAHYFSQSQQIDVMFHLAVNERTAPQGESNWAAGGIMLERMPEEGGLTKDPPTTFADATPTLDNIKGWDYNALLVDTATEEELLDPHLAPSALLYRLFNEGGVWVHETKPVYAECRCSREKIENILSRMDYESLVEMMQDDGYVGMTCQFCNKEERFSADELKALHNVS